MPVRETLLLCTSIPLWRRRALALPQHNMDESSNAQLAAATWSPEMYVDSTQGVADPPIEPASHSLRFASGYSEEHRSHTTPTVVVVEPEWKLLPFSGEEGPRFPTDDENWRNRDDLNTAQATNDEDEAIFLENDPAKMSSWTGQPSVKGSSETMRMMMLTFSSVGMTYAEPAHFRGCTWADDLFAASLGASK